MKLFLLKCFIAFVSIFLGASVLDYTICRGLLKMEDSRFQDYASMLRGGMEHDVIIMGNSRGKSHFYLPVLDSLCRINSFCIGIGGYPLNVQLSKLKLYLAHNAKPKLILQQIDYMSMDIIPDVRYRHQSEQFFPLVYDPVMRQELKQLGYGFPELFIPMYRMYGYQMVIKNGLLEALHLRHYVSNPSYKGSLPEDGQWDGTELERMPVHPVILPEKGKVILEQYIRLCKQDSIRVVLVNSPIYTGAIPKLPGFLNAKKYFEQFAEKNHVTYLDYTIGCPISQSTDNFCVSVHMNQKGTLNFTKRISKDLDSLRIIRFPTGNPEPFPTRSSPASRTSTPGPGKRR